MLTFKKHYFILAVLIFVIEVLIALHVKDNFVRPYVGDVLVVILIYCFLKSFLNVPILPTAIFVLCFSFLIEFLQYLQIVKLLGLQQSKLAKTILGTSFVWWDLVAYTAGVIIIVATEKFLNKSMR